MKNPKIALVFNGVWSHYSFAMAPKYRSLYQLVYVHHLADTDLSVFKAVVIPFQSNHEVLGRNKGKLYDFLAVGGKLFVEGDSSATWLDADWEDRPVNNYWWVTNPQQPPVAETDFNHPVYRGLLPRHACWHTHGAYTRIPDHARVIQRNSDSEIITWETDAYGGTLLATTLDPVVEHGVQQITHLDNYVDRLTGWLCGVQPEGTFAILEDDYGRSWI